MPSPLRSSLQHLAAAFADSVLAAIRAASLEELLTESKTAGPRRGPAPGLRAAPPAPSAATRRAAPTLKPSGRLARRSPGQIAATIDRVATLVKKHPKGLRAEQIRVELGLLPKEMPRVLKEGLAAKKLTCKGQKRATTYFAK
jgi:hypothetical protein